MKDKNDNSTLANIKRESLVLLFFAGLTIALTFPLVMNLATKIPGVASSDNFAYLWKMYWFKHAIIDLGQSPLFAPHIFYPMGFNLAQDEATFVNTLGLLPITWAFGEVVSLNIAILLSFVLGGYGMYLFTRELTGCRWCGLFAGAAFVFSPYHMARSFQHLNLSTIQWIPFAFYFAERTLRYPTRRNALLLGAAYALTALSSWYYAYYIGLMLLVYLLTRWHRPDYALDRKAVKGRLLIAFVLSISIIIPFVLPSLLLHSTGTMSYNLVDVDSYSASPDDFIRPSPFHPIWGEPVKALMAAQFTDWGEHILFIGFVVLFLLVIGVFRTRHDKRILALLWVGAIAFILALGTTLHLGGTRVMVPLPEWLGPFMGKGQVPIPMPGYLLFKYLPFFSSSRVWARFGLMVIFVAAAVAAFNIKVMTEGRPDWLRKAVVIFCVALLCFEFLAAPIPMSRVAPRPVDIWLKGLNERSVILQLPDFSAGPQMYYTKYHGQYLVNGCGAFIDPGFNARMFNLRGLPDNESLRVLHEMDIDYLLLNQEAYGPSWPALKDKISGVSDFILRYDDKKIAVYELKEMSGV